MNYVVCIGFDPVTKLAVLLTKLKGPSFLLNKITFPGGRFELDEDFKEAAAREFYEESGVKTSKSDWSLLFKKEKNESSVYFAVYKSSCIARAKPQESELEKVFLGSLKEHELSCHNNPQLYAPDFKEILRALKEKEF